MLEQKASRGGRRPPPRLAHLLDDRPADHGFFADVDECVWGVWAVLRRRFARDGVADPARAALPRGVDCDGQGRRPEPRRRRQRRPAAAKKGRSE